MAYHIGKRYQDKLDNGMPFTAQIIEIYGIVGGRANDDAETRCKYEAGLTRKGNVLLRTVHYPDGAKKVVRFQAHKTVGAMLESLPQSEPVAMALKSEVTERMAKLAQVAQTHDEV